MKDSISRRAVLKLLAAMPPEEAMTKALLIQGVKQMDAAQPEKRTEERTETHACDSISRQAAIEVADAVWSVTGDKNVAKVWDQIRNLPAAQPEEPSYDAVKEYCRKRCLSIVDTALLGKYTPSAQRWIPCSERLPEDDVEVLVTDDAGGVQWLGVDKMMSYEDGSGRFWLVSQHPSAWMPLPEPYKEEP